MWPSIDHELCEAGSYFQRRILGAPAALANYVVQAWLINVQRSDLALAANAALNVSNALLCVLLGHVLQQGIVGVATATVLANYLALALGLFLILRTCRSFSWLSKEQLVCREVFHSKHLMPLASLRLNGICASDKGVVRCQECQRAPAVCLCLATD